MNTKPNRKISNLVLISFNETDNKSEMLSRIKFRPYNSILAEGREKRMSALKFKNFLFLQNRPKIISNGIFGEINNRIRQVKSWHSFCNHSTFVWTKSILKNVILNIEALALLTAFDILLNIYCKWVMKKFDAIINIKEEDEIILMRTKCLKRYYRKEYLSISIEIQYINTRKLKNHIRKEMLCNTCERLERFLRPTHYLNYSEIGI